MALVQLYEDGKLDLDAPLAHAAARSRHSTTRGRPRRRCCSGTCSNTRPASTTCTSTRPTCSTARPTCRSRRCCSATRRRGGCDGNRARGMAYANPGYGVAGLVIEKMTGKPFEDVIANASSPRSRCAPAVSALAPDADAALAQGYDAPDGQPVTRRAHLSASRRRPPDVGQGARQLRADAARLGRAGRAATSSIRNTSRTWNGHARRPRRRPGCGPATAWASSAPSTCRITCSATTAASTGSCRRTATHRRGTWGSWCC